MRTRTRIIVCALVAVVAIIACNVAVADPQEAKVFKTDGGLTLTMPKGSPWKDITKQQKAANPKADYNLILSRGDEWLYLIVWYSPGLGAKTSPSSITRSTPRTASTSP